MPDQPVAYRPRFEGDPWPWVVVEGNHLILPEPIPKWARPISAEQFFCTPQAIWVRGRRDWEGLPPYRLDGATGTPLCLNKWLMARWGAAIVAHDALCQVYASLRMSHVCEGGKVRPQDRAQARAFRRYADRQMVLILKRLGCPWPVRWLAWGAVRVNAKWKEWR